MTRWYALCNPHHALHVCIHLLIRRVNSSKVKLHINIFFVNHHLIHNINRLRVGVYPEKYSCSSEKRARSVYASNDGISLWESYFVALLAFQLGTVVLEQHNQFFQERTLHSI